MKSFQRVHSLLVSELEKKYSQTVILLGQVIIYPREILHRNLFVFSVEFFPNQHENRRHNRNKNDQESSFILLLSIEFFFFSRTLTAVHDAILHDLVYPAEITGKRIRIKQDGSRLFKVHLDKNQQTLVENKVYFH